MADPNHMTPQELAADAVASLENWCAYRMQSKRTKAGARAEPTPRSKAVRALRLLMPCRPTLIHIPRY